jgi:hypothetical protein
LHRRHRVDRRDLRLLLALRLDDHVVGQHRPDLVLQLQRLVRQLRVGIMVTVWDYGDSLLNALILTDTPPADAPRAPPGS